MRKFIVSILSAIATACLSVCLFTACGSGSGNNDNSNYNDGKKLTYTLLEDNTYSVTVGECYTLPVITIPASYLGKPVSTIGTNFFELGQEYSNTPGNTPSQIKTYKIVAEEGVTTIGANAFYGNTFDWIYSLRAIEIPKSLVNFPEAFSFPQSMREICNKGDIVFQAGEYGYGGIQRYVTNIYTPESGASKLLYEQDTLYYIDGESKSLLGYYGSAVDYTTPDDINAVEGYAFFDNNTMEKLTVSGNVKTVSNYAFYECYALREFYVLNGVESIGVGAFGYCENVERFHIDSSVTEIGNGAFNFMGYSRPTKAIGYFEVAKNAKPSGYPSDSDMLGSTYTSGADFLYGVSEIVETQDGFIYALLQNSVTLIKYEGTAKNVVVADEYNQKPITEIYCYAFAENKTMMTIDFGNSVNRIYRDAFYDCDGLYEVIFPDNITSVLQYAFYGCDRVRRIEIGTGLYNEGGGSSVGAAFDNKCYEVYNGSGDDLASLQLSNWNCYIYEDKNASKITYVDGFMIFDGNTIIDYVGEEREITLPDSTAYSIARYAFNYCDVDKITVPATYSEIPDSLFLGCQYVTEVNLPDTITSMGQWAFNVSGTLTIRYAGTISQWEELTNGVNWCNVENKPTVICSDGVVGEQEQAKMCN